MTGDPVTPFLVDLWRFGALSGEEMHAYQALLQNSRDVADLLADNPFPDGAPKYVRAVLYEYRFANAEQQAKGQWWVRQRAGVFYPPVMRADD